MTVRRLRVFIVEDHPLMRSGIRTTVEGHHDVVGEADNADSAIELIRERKPDVVLLDIRIPGGGGHRVVAEVRLSHPDVEFLAYTNSEDPNDFMAVIRAGARGYLLKNTGPRRLLAGIERTSEGKSTVSARLAGYALKVFTDEDTAAVDPELDSLTPREFEVVQLIARSFTYREIGERLFISHKTVETHVSHVLRKLQLSNRTQLARWAYDRRLID